MKVLFVSGIDGDTRRYRCFHHQEQLSLEGIVSELRDSSDFQLYLDVLEYDLFILHRVPASNLIYDLINLAQLQRKPVIFETDDLVFDPALVRDIPYLDNLSLEEAQDFQRKLFGQSQTFELCDTVLTTTEALANEARHRGKKAFVHRNAPSVEMIHISEQAYLRYKKKNEYKKNITIGYFSGTGSHDRDFRVVTPALIAILETYPGVGLHISGHLNLDSLFEPFAHRIRRIPYISWRELPYLIAKVDINLAPLEMDNPFCQAKSEIKFVEAALVGTPTVATPTDAYRYAIAPGVNGLWAASTEEWIEALTLLIRQPERSRALGEAARQRVYESYRPEQRGLELLALLKTLADDIPPPEVRDPLVYEISKRMKGSLDQLSQTIRQQEKQLSDLRLSLEQWGFALSQSEHHSRKEMNILREELARKEGDLREELAQKEEDLRKAEQAYLRSLTGILERLEKVQGASV
jgi:O-antigen biosynthesis protein